MTDEDVIKIKFNSKPVPSESPEVPDNFKYNGQDSVNAFGYDIDASIGTILSSSFHSNTMHTVTLSSMDSSDFKLDHENVFGGCLSIEELIRQYSD